MTKKEKVVKKIHNLMEKWGVTADELAEFGKDLDVELVDTDFEDDREEPEVEGEVELQETEPETQPVVEEEVEETLEEEQVEPLPPLPEPATEEPQPQPEPQPEPVETATPEQVKDLRVAVDGLVAKVEGLIDSLTKAGVLMVENNEPVGVESTTAPSVNPDVSFDDVLGELNRGRKY